jgi:DNA polymerase-1
MISFDIETYDPNLLTKGQGTYRNDGYVLGVAIFDGKKPEYYNVNPKNCPPALRKKNIDIIKNILENNDSKIGTNIRYDIEWLTTLQINVKGELFDIQTAEPLIDENQYSYSLDNLSKRYLGRGKDNSELINYCKERNLKGDYRQHIYMMPYELVKKYAISDVVEPFEIWNHQKQILESQELYDLFRLEMDLFPVLLQMRKTGIRIDTQSMEKTIKDFEDEYEKELQIFENLCGKKGVNYNSANELQPILDSLKIKYPLTPKTKAPSITQPFIEEHEDRYPILKSISNCRMYRHMIDTFLVSNLQEMIFDGRVRCSFNPLKSDTYGTVTGRFSCSTPNLQQIPKRNENVKNKIRSLFLPELEQQLVRMDYSQIEIRLMAHYAVGPGSDALRKQFIEDTDTDFHQWCADIAGIPNDRELAKRVNFGIQYGMGIRKLCSVLGMKYDESKQFLDMYHAKLPFIKKTLNKAAMVAENRGYVKTLLGRRRRFPNKEKTYRALNAVIQGSGADMIKKAMVVAHKKGLFDILSIHLQIHDELVVSQPNTKQGQEAAKELKNIMETIIPLRVPVIADCKIGENWGEMKEYI